MKTSIIGYPRIGGLRELKFASEKYFRGEISASDLEAEAKKIRLYNLSLQKNSGLDFIPSNDFSFYDAVLDTAFLLGLFPRGITSWDFPCWTPTLRQQEDIRAKRAMSRLLL